MNETSVGFQIWSRAAMPLMYNNTNVDTRRGVYHDNSHPIVWQ